MTEVALIDLSGMFWRYYHARADEAVNTARHAVVSDIHGIARKHQHCAIALDSRKSWRKEKYPAYKAQREPHEEQALEQMRRTIETLRDDGFCMLEAEGYEADDVIASACAAVRDMPVSIYSSDKDLLQCLRSGVADSAVVRVNIAKAPPSTDTVQSLVEIMGIKPEQIPDWLALMGDVSDNVPGVTKCGHKTAAKWLQKWGTVDGVVRAACDRDDALTELQQRNIMQASDNPDCPLSLALKLVTLRTDLPIDVAAILAPRVAKQKPQEAPIQFAEREDTMSDQNETPPAASSQPDSAEVVADVVDAEGFNGANGKGTAMVVRDVSWERALEPVTLKDAWNLSRVIDQSRLFSAYGTPQAIMTAILAGRSYGLDAMSALRGFHIIKGRPVMSSQLMHALCLRHPQCEFFRMVESTDERATFETKRKTDPAPTRLTFTLEDAKTAGLTGKADSNWTKYPKPMLRARAVAELARAVFPDAVGNTYVEGEIE